ncbi:MAG: efflux RND transporter permease subunit [Caulobacterales bacterium]
MNLSAPFVRRPIGTVLLTVGIALAGAAAFFKLPVSPLPQVDFPTVAVSASLPGASPNTMATSVATPLERHLGIISNVSEMTSNSGTGQANIVLQFDLDRDIDGAARDVQAAINAARVDLPATLRSNPVYRKLNPADAPIVILAMTSKTKTPAQIYDAAATVVQQQLSQVKGVGDVTIGGASLPAVRVELNPVYLSRFGISMEDVRAALASANANRPKGIVDEGGQRLQIYTNDAGTTAADYRSLVIAYRSGSAVRLSDVAEVVDGQEDIHNLGLYKGQPAVLVVISRQPGANIISTVDAVKARIPALKQALPQDIDMQTAVDRTITIRSSLAEVERTVLFATILVVGVVAFYLMNGKAVLIPSVAVAVSLLGAIAVMFLLGFSLDNLSLMALTVSTGFVVDDAIVVLENITRHVEAGMDRFEAALKGAEEVGFTVLSISMSLIAVFLPILLMGGIIGRLFREFAVTLSTAIIVSLAISLTTTPMMCAYLIDRPKPFGQRSWLGRIPEQVFGWMIRVYEKGLDWALESGPIVVTILIVTIVLNWYLFAVVPKGFLPQQDTGQLQGGLQSDQSSSFQISQRRMKTFVRTIQADPAVDTVVAFTGGRSSGGFLQASLKPRSERQGGANEAIQRLRPELAQVTGASLFLNDVQDFRAGGRQANATYQYTLQADSLQDLRTWAVRLTDQLKTDPAVTDVNSDQQDHGLQAFVRVDPNAALRLGVTSASVDNTLYDAFGQRQVSTIYKDVNQYHVIMEAAPQWVQDPTALRYIDVSTSRATAGPPGSGAAQGLTPIGFRGQQGAHVTPATQAAAAASGLTGVLASRANPATTFQAASGSAVAAVSGPSAPPARAASAGVAVSSAFENMVPLSSIASWADSATPTSINHQDAQPATTISFNLAPGKSLSDATQSIAEAEAAIGMPATIHGGFAGTARVFAQSLSSEPILILAALAAIYLVLGILYESYIHPLTVLSTLPSAGVGAMIALIVFHIEFSIISLIGIILLIGIVKKNAILMIDFALDAERQLGLAPQAAIRQAALTRFRPIMMTTFAAILGALPLAIGWGEGSELRRPLGVTIIGGLILSQIITLITTPVVYLYLDRFHRRTRREAARGLEGPAPAPAPAS